MDPAGQRGGAGGHVDQESWWLGRSQNPFRAQIDRFNVRGQAHDGNHDLSAICSLGGGLRPVGPSVQELLGSRTGSGVNGEVMTGIQEVSGHGGPHHPGSEKGDPHCSAPGVIGCQGTVGAQGNGFGTNRPDDERVGRVVAGSRLQPRSDPSLNWADRKTYPRPPEGDRES